MLITGQPLSAVSVLPQGQEAVFTLEQADFILEGVRCCVLKDGATIDGPTRRPSVRWLGRSRKGKNKRWSGVGRGEGGLKVPVGEAINPYRQMIRRTFSGFCLQENQWR